MQIRSDRAEGGMKYRWFSSNPAKGFTLGTKAQTWVHVTGDSQSKVASRGMKHRKKYTTLFTGSVFIS